MWVLRVLYSMLECATDVRIDASTKLMAKRDVVKQ